jgi:hypothetical protein
MKWNPWTLALIGAGVISLPGASYGEEKPSSVLTALSSTTLSGYVDTSAHWNPGTGNANLPGYTGNGALGGSKADGFNLDVVALTITKPTGEEPWAAGYNATLLFGPDAVGYNPTALNLKTPGDFSLKDTYVELKAPVGNGLDLKLGTFTELNGYEVYEAGNNPNYTRSYGYMIEPTQLTGVLAAYQLTPAVLLSAGIADTWSAGINSRANPPKAESFKTYMGAISFVCPTNCGFLSGSTLMGAVTSGWDAINGVDKTSLYVGATFNTPISTLKLGLAHDYVLLGPIAPDTALGGTTGAQSSGYQQASGIYLNWQATEKLSFNTRAEYFTQSGYLVGTGAGAGDGLPSQAVELTETVQYQLWKNVISRLEFRWDHALSDTPAFGGQTLGTPTLDNAFLVAANIIYKF